MIKRFQIVILLHFIFFMNVCFAGINNTIVARVENEIITSYEIKNRILNSLILANQDINQENINKLKRQSLESLIQLKLKKIELLKHEINYNSEQMTLYLNQISSNDIDGLKSKFKINNLDYELFYKQVETQLKWQRLIYKLYNPTPPLGNSIFPGQRILAKLNHIFLYISILMITISGILKKLFSGEMLDIFFFNLEIKDDFELAELFYEIHIIGNYTLIALISLHILAVVIHRTLFKESLLNRIL